MSRVRLGPGAPTPHAYGPGRAPARWQVGDVLLTRGDGLFPRLIRVGQRIRYRGPDRRFAWFNHAAIVTCGGDRPRIVEALSRGIVVTDPRRYQSRWYAVVDVNATPAQRDLAARYALRAGQLGTRYGWTRIVSIASTLLTNGRLVFGTSGQAICSGLVAEALRAAGMWWERDGRLEPTGWVMPADLASSFNTEQIAGDN